MDKSKHVVLLCIVIAVVMFILFLIDVFFDDESYVDRHIREMKYDAAQINRFENQEIEEKLYG